MRNGQGDAKKRRMEGSSSKGLNGEKVQRGERRAVGGPKGNGEWWKGRGKRNT
jgi:hypothetical protein